MGEEAIVFVAFKERENLGIGYLASVLTEARYSVRIIDVNRDQHEILNEICDLNPLLVGFSVIFERHIYKFQELTNFLRESGVSCHFTAGGHFASLRPETLFSMFPSLDSVVRFEGEHTTLELVQGLKSGADLKQVKGLSYRTAEGIKHNLLRPLEKNLDSFPYPYRDELFNFGLRKRYSTIIAGRGCVYNCIYCNIREFYATPGGPLKRIRDPVRVVEEMEYLHKKKNCSIFLFQDDDFPVSVRKDPDWPYNFCRSIRDRDLKGNILWKINCRPDEIDRKLFSHLKEHGLYKVFLGIEEGTDSGLKKLNKKLKVEDSLNAIDTLKSLGISIDFGFMLFQPDSTFQVIRRNLAFLQTICDDGYMPAIFLKMMPYLGTQVEKDLEKKGNLKGKPGFLDYEFSDSRLDAFYEYVYSALNNWLYGAEGLVNLSKWCKDYLSVFNLFYKGLTETGSMRMELETHLSQANQFLLLTLIELSFGFESGRFKKKDDISLKKFTNNINKLHENKTAVFRDSIQKMELYSLTSGLFV